MVTSAFASARALERDELEGAPVHYPRPSRLVRPLRVQGSKAQHGAEILGLLTIGDLLEHLPRDRREARAILELRAAESATVVVEVRSISSRSVRIRVVRPIVATAGADEPGGASPSRGSIVGRPLPRERLGPRVQPPATRI